jgi:AraC family transcriptional regulator
MAAFVQRALPTVPDVEVRECIGIPIAYLRHIGSYASVPLAYERLFAWAREHQGIWIEGSPIYGRAPDDPDITPQDKLRFDVCVPVHSRDCPSLNQGILFGEIPSGRYAIIVHRGPYNTLSDSYLELIGRWVPAKACKLADEPVIEAYVNDPKITAPDDLITEIRIRIV